MPRKPPLLGAGEKVLLKPNAVAAFALRKLAEFAKVEKPLIIWPLGEYRKMVGWRVARGIAKEAAVENDALAAGAIRADGIRTDIPPPRLWAPAAEQIRVAASAAAANWNVLIILGPLAINDARTSPAVAETQGDVEAILQVWDKLMPDKSRTSQLQ